jgi:hypothetical protein
MAWKQGSPVLRRLRAVAVYLALAALVLRALVPVGWMPDASASTQTTLIPCPMMDGMRGMATPQQKQEPQHPGKHQLPVQHEGSICPFATAAHPIRAIEPQQIEIIPPRFGFFAAVSSVLAPKWDHAPRAPPVAV